MASKKNKKDMFTMTDKDATVMEMLNTMQPATPGDAGTKTLNEVDDATKQAVLNRLEIHNRKILLLVKPSVHEELKDNAWEHRTSVNNLINELIENYLDSERERKAQEQK